ncbi:hypothetical protein MBLNU457_4924t1 [Dothideomycetes sp. NU457]
MRDSLLAIVSTVLFFVATGLAFGLTYAPCYSAFCSEDYYPYVIRVYLAACYATLAASILILICRRYSDTLRRAFAALVFDRPIPFTSIHLSWGAVITTTVIVFIFGFGHGYLVHPIYDYYEMRGTAAAGSSDGAIQLAIVGITGHFQDYLVGLVIIPVAREGVVARFSGLEPSTLIRMHKLTAYLLQASLIVHTVAWIAWVPVWATGSAIFRETFSFNNVAESTTATRAYPYYNAMLGAGIAGLVVLLVIVISSLPKFRRTSYNTFYYLHSLSILFFILVCIHASTNFYLLIPGLFLYVLDWALRAKSLSQAVNAEVQKDANGWYRIIIPGDSVPAHVSGREAATTDLPLKTYYLNVPSASKFENHPFTACNGALSASENGRQQDIVFLLRVPTTGKPEKQQAKEWTTKIQRLVDPVEKTSQTDLEIGNGLTVEPKDERKLSGETLAGTCSRTIKLRIQGPYTIPHSPFNRYDAVLCVIGGTGISGALSLANTYIALKMSGKPCLTQRFSILWSLRDTEDADLVDVSNMLALAAKAEIDVVLEKHITGTGRSRLDFTTALPQRLAGEESTWVYFSGPDGLMNAAEQACIDFKSARRRADKAAKISSPRLDWYCAKWDV